LFNTFYSKWDRHICSLDQVPPSNWSASPRLHLKCLENVSHSGNEHSVEAGDPAGHPSRTPTDQGGNPVKPSLYNWVVEHEGKMTLFNGATGCSLEVDEANRLAVAAALMADKTGHALRAVNPRIRSCLLDGGFLVDERFDELASLRRVSLVPIRTRTLSGATAIVTTRCNLACPDCGQDPDRGRDMTPDVVDRLIEAVAGTDSPHFEISLGGGEPLLVPGTCTEIARKAATICKQKGLKLHVSLSTNGYLLDKRMARRMANAGVSNVQIAIDGNRDLHDKRRPLNGGGATYSRIVDNVFNATEHMNAVVWITSDVSDQPAVESLENLARAFAGNERVSLRFLPASGNGIVRPAPGLSALGGCIGNLGNHRKSIRHGESAGAAANPRSFLLMPDGAFALCWDGIGIDGTGPSLPGPEALPPVRRVRLTDWNPYGTPPCSECRRLPTCGGGCPRIWALTGRHECAFGSDADYLHFIRANFLSAGQERVDRLVEEACDPAAATSELGATQAPS
jgi:uncharacterized protein